MLNLFFKILKTPNNVIPITAAEREQAELTALGKNIQSKIKRLFKGSLAIRQVDAGSDNACEQELVALSNAFYDVERFGIHFVASPKHADMLLVTGPVTENMAEALRRAYACTPNPKIVVAVGNDAIDLNGVHSVIPVDYQIPGDPPSPKTILIHLLNIFEDLDKVQ